MHNAPTHQTRKSKGIVSVAVSPNGERIAVTQEEMSDWLMWFRDSENLLCELVSQTQVEFELGVCSPDGQVIAATHGSSGGVTAWISDQ